MLIVVSGIRIVIIVSIDEVCIRIVIVQITGSDL